MAPIEPCAKCGSWNLYPDPSGYGSGGADGWGCFTCEGRGPFAGPPPDAELIARLRKRIKEEQESKLFWIRSAEARWPLYEIVRRFWWLPLGVIKRARAYFDSKEGGWPYGLARR